MLSAKPKAPPLPKPNPGEASAGSTIVAVATAAGMGGVGIVRVSGPLAPAIASCLFPKPMPPRQLVLGEFLDAQGLPVDQGLAVLFPAPNSFTGEDVLEFQGHGGPTVLRLLVEACLQLGATLAAPGEFSQRAFLNGKLDLAQAEAVADLIASGSEQAARSALRSLQGVFSDQVTRLDERLRELRLFVEATLDFPDEEDVDRGADFGLTERLVEIVSGTEALLRNTRSAAKFTEGITVALLGAPNAGKSSLLNSLSGEERAIVTDIPGTTRDLLPVDLSLDGLPVRLVDTAGVRHSSDPVEREGVNRALKQAEQADVVLVLLDGERVAWDEFARPPEVQRQNESDVWKTDSNPRIPGLTERLIESQVPMFNQMHLDLGRLVVAISKADLYEGKLPQNWLHTLCIESTSAATGQGLDSLIGRIKSCAGVSTESSANTFTARQRHVLALEESLAAMLNAQQLATEQVDGGVLLAEELRIAHDSLGSIVGHTTADDLLGDIFSNFCIGK